MCVVGGRRLVVMVVVMVVCRYHLFRNNVFLFCCVMIGVVVCDVVFGFDDFDGMRCCSLPFWKNEFTWFDDDLVNFAKSGSIDDGCQFMMTDSS